MCGIFGFSSLKKDCRQLDLDIIADELRHRGPDGSGRFTSRETALVHTRLSIIDLASGAQPIYNEDASVVLVYNGEIYNYKELRAGLEERGHIFKTHTDSEILVHLYEEGTDFPVSLNGMFAFIIWDIKKHILFAARDRFGIKPLYYATRNNDIALSSEIKPIFASGIISPAMNLPAVDRYFSYRFNKGNETVFDGIKKIPPGHACLWQDGHLSISPFWQQPDRLDISERPEAELLEEYDSLLMKSVKSQLMSDVPLGIFLSGGVDSTSICGDMKRLGVDGIKSFTIGFMGAADESARAAKISSEFGASGRNYIMQRDDLNMLPQIQRVLEEPFGDIIVVPTFKLAELAAKEVKVVLTGEGGDEFLGGYIHQKSLCKYETAPMLKTLSPLIGGMIGLAPVPLLDKFFDYPASMGTEGKKRLANIFKSSTETERYMTFVSLFGHEEKKKLYTSELMNAALAHGPDYKRAEKFLSNRECGILDRLIMQDVDSWLPDNILFKVDKLCMGHSIEGRFPFLDNDLADFSLRLPLSMKLRGKETKYILKETLKNKILPGFDFKGKKPFYFSPFQMFPDFFLNHVKQSLPKERIEKSGLLNWSRVNSLINTPAQGILWEKQIISILCFAEWYDQFFK